MKEKIELLKLNFININNIQIEIKSLFNNIEIKILKLKKLYKLFINGNTETKYIIGLDTFRFQTKLIDIEFEDIKKFDCLINNRLYCEYYKLLKLICNLININFTDTKLLELTNYKKYPIYKDLETYKIYNLEDINNIYNNLLNILESLYQFTLTKNIDIVKYEHLSNMGLNINNFINTLKFELNIAKEQIILINNYLYFFNEIHIKYFTRFIIKVKLLFTNLNNDIKFENNFKNEMFNNNEIYDDNSLDEMYSLDDINLDDINLNDINDINNINLDEK